jgi:hypothetical protein
VAIATTKMTYFLITVIFFGLKYIADVRWFHGEIPFTGTVHLEHGHPPLNFRNNLFLLARVNCTKGFRCDIVYSDLIYPLLCLASPFLPSSLVLVGFMALVSHVPVKNFVIFTPPPPTFLLALLPNTPFYIHVCLS